MTSTTATKTFRRVLGALAAAFAMGAAAQTWPAQPIKIIVPFTAGTGMDTIARAVSPRLSERLGQPGITVAQRNRGAARSKRQPHRGREPRVALC